MAKSPALDPAAFPEATGNLRVVHADDELEPSRLTNADELRIEIAHAADEAQTIERAAGLEAGFHGAAAAHGGLDQLVEHLADPAGVGTGSGLGDGDGATVGDAGQGDALGGGEGDADGDGVAGAVVQSDVGDGPGEAVA